MIVLWLKYFKVRLCLINTKNVNKLGISLIYNITIENTQSNVQSRTLNKTSFVIMYCNNMNIINYNMSKDVMDQLIFFLYKPR